jgi:hypothetical protein
LIDRGKKADNLFNLMGVGTKRIRRLEPHSKNHNPGGKESPEPASKKILWPPPALFPLVNCAKGSSHLVGELFLGKLQLNPKALD